MKTLTWRRWQKQLILQLKASNQHIFNKGKYKEALFTYLIMSEQEIKGWIDTHLLGYGIEDFTIESLESAIEEIEFIHSKREEIFKTIQRFIVEWL